MLHVFVDESGIPGDTLNFVIGFAFFSDTDYKTCVDNIKLKIKILKGKEPKELHFHDMTPELREKFLGGLVDVGGKFGYIHAQKDRINEEFRDHPNNNLMYNLILFYLIENIVKSGYSEDHITVYVDQRGDSKTIKRGLATYLPRKINPLLNGYRLYVRWEKSHNSRGIQCADSICGSVYRKFTKNDYRYYDIIKRNLVIERANLFG
ncbi:MAG: DUF3800 domain-containing protein [Methanotrichaceae archaeon]